jgi:hypothetical protein
MRLGKEHFSELVTEIAEHVLNADPRVPETQWTVADTREKVNEILGKEDSKAKMDIGAHWTGKDVKLDDLAFWIGDYKYEVGSIMPLDHFKKIAGRATVRGLGDDWRT